jgi:hypothetical protein
VPRFIGSCRREMDSQRMKCADHEPASARGRNAEWPCVILGRNHRRVAGVERSEPPDSSVCGLADQRFASVPADHSHPEDPQDRATPFRRVLDIVYPQPGEYAHFTSAGSHGVLVGAGRSVGDGAGRGIRASGNGGHPQQEGPSWADSESIWGA